MTSKHRWGDPVRPDQHRTFRGCTVCGMCQISRHEGGQHWVQFEHMPEETTVYGYDGTPPCDPIATTAEAA